MEIRLWVKIYLVPGDNNQMAFSLMWLLNSKRLFGIGFMHDMSVTKQVCKNSESELSLHHHTCSQLKQLSSQPPCLIGIDIQMKEVMCAKDRVCRVNNYNTA